MITYVNTVLVSSRDSGAVLSAAPATSASMNTPSTDAGKFILMNCDPGVASTKIYEVTAANAAGIQTIKVGIVTKKNLAVHNYSTGAVTYQPIIKWSNEIKANDIKSYNILSYTADTEDKVYIDFNSINAGVLGLLDDGGKRIITRLTFKDLPNRYRKWTESYEYVTKVGDNENAIAKGIAALINKEWKRARVKATVGTVTYAADGVTFSSSGKAIELEALPYDDDNANESLNQANKVRFNGNVYFTDPAAEGWEANNKHFPQGVIISKVPGKQYAASAKLIRDHEDMAMGYQGILNRGQGTWPIIKPTPEVDITKHYDGITLEFENMYRAADDIFRKTKQTLEVYGVTEQLSGLKAILDAFIVDNTDISTIMATLATKQDKITGTQGNFVGFGANNTLVDSTKKPADFVAA